VPAGPLGSFTVDVPGVAAAANVFKPTRSVRSAASADRAALAAAADATEPHLFIGRTSLNAIERGPGEDILIGRTTLYDNSAAAVAAVIREWASTASFQQRCGRLDGGFWDSAAGWVQLRRKERTNLKGTVLDDRVTDVLFGGGASDWFLDFAKDEASNRGDGHR
jgi:hypothetical protein